MKTLKNLWWLGAIAALAACNPYSEENKGAPNLVAALATGGNAGAADGTVSDGTLNATTGQWEIESSATCAYQPVIGEDATGATVKATGSYVQPDTFLIWVKTDKLLDGATIQSNASSCVPAGDWLKVEQTTTASATPVDVSADWYTCYQPGSPSANEGSSIVFYRSAPRVPGEPVAGDVTEGGWYTAADADPRDYVSPTSPNFTTWVTGDMKEFTTLTFTGEVKDQQGHPLPIKIAYTIDPDAGAVALGLHQPTTSLQPPTPEGGTPPPPKVVPDPFIGTSEGVTGTEAAPVVALEAPAGACTKDAATNASYLIFRKELSDAAYPTTPLTTFAAPAPATLAFNDTSATYGKQYTYKIQESIPYSGATEPFVKTLSTRKVTVLLPPAAPTLDAETTPGQVTVTWTAVPQATSYTVQRNIANTTSYVTPVPGSTWITVKTTSDATTLSIADTGRTAGTVYFYRVIARAVVGTDADGADVIGTSEPGHTGGPVTVK